MTLNELLAELAQKKVKLSVEQDQLRIAAPKGVLTAQLRTQLQEKKTEILAFLQKATHSNYTPITPVSIDQDIPLSYSQERLWLLEQLVPGNTAYNLFLAYHLVGTLCLEALGKSLQEIQQRHEILRTILLKKNNQVFQQISPELVGQLEVDDRSFQDCVLGSNKWEELITTVVQHKYDLTQAPLWRIKVIRLNERENLLILTMHHFITDGTSLKNFMAELSELYAAKINDLPFSLPPLPLQYKDYAVWQRQWLEGAVLKSQLDYWQQHLAGEIAPLKLPTCFQPAAIKTYRAERIGFKIPQTLAKQVKLLANQEGVTLFIVLLGTFSILLNRYTDQEDLILCSPVAGRNQSELDQLIGYFNNILPIRVNLEGDPTFRDVIARIRNTTVDAYENQDVPFQKLAELPNLANATQSKALFALQNAPSEALKLPEIVANSLDISKGMTDFDLSFFMEERGEIISGEVIFKTDLFDQPTIAAMVENYQNIIQILVIDPSKKISDLPQFKVTQAQLLEEIQTYEKPEYVSPRDEIEIKLVKIWEQVLNIHPIGIKDHFFHTLGGTSILAFRLFSEIDKAFGKNLPLAALIEAPTIDKLGAVLTEKETKSFWTSLVPIKTSGTKPPLFCIHPVGGNVIGYVDLADSLSEDQPLYGLQIRGLDGYVPLTYDVKEMAREYLRDIRAFQPEGPYYLAGHSGGGIIAFEIAQQIVAQGEKVALLAMFDSYNPTYLLNTRAEDRKYFQQQRLGGFIKFKIREFAYKLEFKILVPVRKNLKILRQNNPKQGASFVVTKMKKQLARLNSKIERKTYKIPDDPKQLIPYSLREQVIIERLTEGLMAYVPQPYQGKITLFSTYTSRFRVSNISDDDDRGWNAVSAQGVEIHKVPGDHFNLLTYPSVLTLAEQLQLSLDQAIGDCSQITKPNSHESMVK